MCTTTCTANADCAALSSAATCMLPPAGSACTDRRCDQACTNNSDCSSRGIAFRCFSGVCQEVGPTGDAGTPGPDAAPPNRHDAALPAPDASPVLDGGRNLDSSTTQADASVPTCDSEPCFCDHLAACSPGELTAALPLGSMGRRVCGVRIRRGNPGGLFCEATAFSETEGGVIGVHCEAPLGVGCGTWLPGPGSPYCHEILNCNVLMQSCPLDFLDCNRAEPGDAGTPMPSDASTCTSIETQIVAEWAKVSECTSPADCTVGFNNLCANGGPIVGPVDCYLPINRSANVSTLSELERRYLLECGSGVTCDCPSPPPADCVAGHCKAIGR